MEKVRPLNRNGPSLLKTLLKKGDTIMAPGAYDALSAKLIEAAGFEMAYISGFATAASRLGFPDVGLITMSEMLENAGNIVNSIQIPVIGDADTGYGNPINVIRTVQTYESVGLAGLQLEDQIFPKKCGHMEGKHVIEMKEMVSKIRAAVDARHNSDFQIVARTDAIAVEGIESAIERAKSYKDAGADILFVEAPETLEQTVDIAKELKGEKLIFNWAEGGKSPQLDLETIKELGFSIVIFPVSTLLSSTKAMMETLKSIRDTGSPVKTLNNLLPFGDFLDFIGLKEIYKLEKKYA